MPRAGAVLAELGLPVATLDQQMVHLSGGQAARASLASLLLARFDVFLLDEPLETIEVEVVRRLVEQEHVEAGQQERRQRRPGYLPQELSLIHI